MRIAVIGHVGGHEPKLVRIAGAAGHRVEFHPGAIEPRSTDDLRGLVMRSDLLVVVTEGTSLETVLRAKRLARDLECASVVLERCGVARFRALLVALAVRERRALRYGS
jgi:hypothetical protein